MATQDGDLLPGTELTAGPLDLVGHQNLLAANTADGSSCSKRNSTHQSLVGRAENLQHLMAVELGYARISELKAGD